MQIYSEYRSVVEQNIRSGVLEKLYSDWYGWCVDMTLPSRADFDPVEMKYALGHVTLVEVHGTPGRRRFRVHGQYHADHHQFDLTGRWLEEHPGDEMPALIEKTYSEVADSGRPTHYLRDAILDGRHWRYEVLILPLSADGHRVDVLLVGADFDQ